MRRIKNIHLVGIGGSGMAGIAEVLHNLGYNVSGSDIHKSNATIRLSSLGIKVTYSHIAENVAECDVVVTSSAINQNNIEVLNAKARRIPIVPRAQMLAELMRFKQGIAVAGTHGKTTTTSLLATILAEGGLDPTYVIGGQLNHIAANAKLGLGEYFIAEADESDASFLHLTPTMSIITNIDSDHMATYDHDFQKLSNTFVDFIHNLPFYGLTVLCIDDPNIQEIIPKISRPYLTYGFDKQADFTITNLQQRQACSSFEILFNGEQQPTKFVLNLPGKHNVLNAVAAMIIALEIGIEIPKIQKALVEFQGIGRRFEITPQLTVPKGKVMLVDDYGHHPREVMAVIQAIRSGWPEKRLVLVFQPHRYSRTESLFEDFIDVLSTVDKLLLLEVYAAGEAPIPYADSRSLCGSIRKRGKIDPIFVKNNQDLTSILQETLADGDILLMQGAGDIGKLVKLIVNQLPTLSNNSHLERIDS